MNKKISELKNKLSPETPGFILSVFKNEQEVFSINEGRENLKGKKTIDKQSLFDIGSMAKQFIGFSIALLVDKGLLSVDDDIKKYISFLDGISEKITVEDLLHHKSGLKNYTTFCYFVKGMNEKYNFPNNEIKEILNRITELNFKPGSRYEYCDTNYFLLAQIIENITDLSISEFLRKEIFIPLKMENTFTTIELIEKNTKICSYCHYEIKDESTYAYDRTEYTDKYFERSNLYEHIGAEGICTCVEDLFKWNKNILHNKLGNNPENVQDLFLTKGKLGSGEEQTYCFGIEDLIHMDFRMIGHEGGINSFSSGMWYLPELNMTIIALSNQTDVRSWDLRNTYMRTLKETEVKAGSEENIQKKINKEYIGKYQDKKTSSFLEITENDYLLNFEPVVLDEKEIKANQYGLTYKDYHFKRYIQDATDSYFKQFDGEYYSEVLDSRLKVISSEGKLLIKNTNSRFNALDLYYKPTIKNVFVNFDPHPGIMVVEFLTDNNEITGLRFRDYDGDKREYFVFDKLAKDVI